MGNLELIILNNKIFIGSDDIMSDIAYYTINQRNSEPLVYATNEEDDGKIMVFTDKEILYEVKYNILCEYPDLDLTIEEYNRSFDKDTHIHVVPKWWFRFPPTFGEAFIKAIESNEEYMKFLQEDPLFYSIVEDILNHIYDKDNKNVAETIVNILYSFINMYKNILGGIGDSLQDEEQQKKISEYLKKLSEVIN